MFFPSSLHVLHCICFPELLACLFAYLSDCYSHGIPSRIGIVYHLSNICSFHLLSLFGKFNSVVRSRNANNGSRDPSISGAFLL